MEYESRVWITNRDGREISIPLKFFLDMVEEGYDYDRTNRVDESKQNDGCFNNSDDSNIDDAIEEFDPDRHRKIELVQSLESGEILWSETDVTSCGCDPYDWCDLCSNLEMMIDSFNRNADECDCEEEHCNYCNHRLRNQNDEDSEQS